MIYMVTALSTIGDVIIIPEVSSLNQIHGHYGARQAIQFRTSRSGTYGQNLPNLNSQDLDPTQILPGLWPETSWIISA